MARFLLLLFSSALLTSNLASSFQFGKRLFGGRRGNKNVELPKQEKNGVEKQKQAILEAISFTNNGKTATEQQQANVLKAVRALELSNPPPEDLLSNLQTAQILNGVWYLQYTSPSKVGEEVESEAIWEPQELEENIETQKFQAKGSVSAAGITVDTSNRETQQIIDVSNQRVSNRVMLDWGQVYVSGKFRQSSKIFNRAVVAFDTAQIIFDNGFTFDLGWAFQILAQIRGTDENGWLETTFVDKNVRIGRGNKGTLFVLTRDPKAVQP